MQTQTDTTANILLAAQYIEDNANEVLNLETLANKIKISPFYFQRKFKVIFGVSPKQFQNAIRIQRLKQALKRGDDISGAIYDSGFGSISRVYEQANKNLGMTLSSYKKGGKNEEIAFALRETSFGHMIMAATDRGVCFVHFADNFTELLHLLHQEFPNAELIPTPDEMTSDLDLWINALEAHLINGSPKPEIPLHLHGTAFQLRVWKFLSSIEEGKQVSYKDVAVGIESPNAYRAAASACAANNIAILIPCHRVLRGDGKLGGYRWGIDRKKHLLEVEGSRYV
jgi:AraC family transcriptional regulator of adaptative response/methylated-DNA-[protein]-cysteine methyltransferase